MSPSDPHDLELPPWEQPDAVRRDCEPHRGELLAKLGNITLYCGAISIVSCMPALVAMPLGLTVWVTARTDLKRMQRGLVDPAGRELTEAAQCEAQLGICLSATPLALLGLLMYLVLSMPPWP